MFYQIGQLAVRTAKGIYQKCKGKYSTQGPDVSVKLAGGNDPLLGNNDPETVPNMQHTQPRNRIQRIWHSWVNPIAASCLESVKSIYCSVILARVIMISANKEDEFYEDAQKIFIVISYIAAADFLIGIYLNKRHGIQIEHTNPAQETFERIALSADFCARYGTVEPTSFGLALGGLSALCYLIEGHGSSQPTLHKAGGGVSQIRNKQLLSAFDMKSYLRATGRFLDLLVASCLIPFATTSGMVLELSPTQPNGEPLPEVIIIATILGSSRSALSLWFKYLEYRVLEHKAHLPSLKDDFQYKAVKTETLAAGFELNYWEALITTGFFIGLKVPFIISSASNPYFWALLLAPLPLGIFGAADALALYEDAIAQRQKKEAYCESHNINSQNLQEEHYSHAKSLKHYFFCPNIQAEEIITNNQLIPANVSTMLI